MTSILAVLQTEFPGGNEMDFHTAHLMTGACKLSCCLINEIEIHSNIQEVICMFAYTNVSMNVFLWVCACVMHVNWAFGYTQSGPSSLASTSCYYELKEVNGLPWQDITDTAMMTCYPHFTFHLFWSLSGLNIVCVCVWEEEGSSERCHPDVFVLNWLPASYFFIILFFLFECAALLAGWLYQEAVSSPGYFNFIGFKEDGEELCTLAPQYNRICQHDPF